jgi:hypothetical protein
MRIASKFVRLIRSKTDGLLLQNPGSFFAPELYGVTYKILKQSFQLRGVGLPVKFALITFFQEPRKSCDTAQGFLQVMRCRIGELLEVAI